MSLKTKIITAVSAIGAILILIFVHGLYSANTPKMVQKSTAQAPSDQVKMVSTVPADLDGQTVGPNQTIEITFNYPIDETQQKFQVNLDPLIDYTTQISADKKTYKIIPTKGFGFGQGYSLTIKGGNKFEGGKTLDSDIGIHFSTTNYSGV